MSPIVRRAVSGVGWGPFDLELSLWFCIWFRKRNRGLTISPLCTRSRDRTGTAITGHRILSPACLPIPPSGQRSVRNDAKVGKNFRIPQIRRR